MTALVVCDDATAAARAAADFLAAAVATAVHSGAALHVVLAGGSTPRAVYEMLARDVPDWTGVELWFSDERVVAADDPGSNARMVRESLGDPPGLTAGQVHRVRTELGARGAATDYADTLTRRVPGSTGGVPSVDVALLGLGEDGHTASLFPNHRALDANDLCVVVDDAPKPPPLRVSLSLPLLCAARRIIVLASGEGKADAAAAMLAAPSRATPASLLPRDVTTLVVDRAAARHASCIDRV